ncbi:hypothetical protein ACUTQ5_09295 [Serratia sp. NA_112.1]|uniref:hypothetical protein n=1 Tax=unclassified Serratia (in: enterobacteria) TaxID=2647522 RepID=UPI004046CEFC
MAKRQNVTGNLLNERKDLLVNVKLTIRAVFQVTGWEITKNEKCIAILPRANKKSGPSKRPV